MKTVVVSGAFDNLRSRQVRFLEEASRIGFLNVLLWTDSAVEKLEGHPPRFPLAERKYFLQSLRYVDRVIALPGKVKADALPKTGIEPDVWVVDEAGDTLARRQSCARAGVGYRVIPEDALTGFPLRRYDALEQPSGRKKVIVTGCFDWLHTGHIRFFEEASTLGDLYVAIGHDRNIERLKGTGHPMFSQAERGYMVQAVRHVKRALVTSGEGWMDAEPEIKWLRPDVYAVNEDGDKPEKRAFCQQHGLEYVVLKRLPKAGLPRRESTALRGF